MQAVAYGGVSVVNAIPSFYGSTMAINLKATAYVKEGSGEHSSKLERTILNYFYKNYNIPRLKVTIDSQIPQRSGLKSSSAVSVALISAIARKFKIKVDVPKLSAYISIKAGVSITGAFDDATAAYYGGITFTDNRKRKLLKITNLLEDLILLILPKSNRPAVNLSAFRKHELMFVEFFRLALSGDIITAMKLNGIAVAEILGYDKTPIKRALRKGALAAGISGNGPSVFALCKPGEEGPVLDELSKFGNILFVECVKHEGSPIPFNH
ncbi:MAG: shikimate kinase [Thermoproteota archaeon]|nr:shikimate kinase [Candidatus Brockarchaeota archaeon]